MNYTTNIVCEMLQSLHGVLSFIYSSHFWSVHEHLFFAIVGTDGCTQGEIRLTGGTDSGEGRAEYCQENRWVPMCSLSFATAGLICAQLGYTQYTCKGYDVYISILGT